MAQQRADERAAAAHPDVPAGLLPPVEQAAEFERIEVLDPDEVTILPQ